MRLIWLTSIGITFALALLLYLNSTALTFAKIFEPSIFKKIQQNSIKKNNILRLAQHSGGSSGEDGSVGRAKQRKFLGNNRNNRNLRGRLHSKRLKKNGERIHISPKRSSRCTEYMSISVSSKTPAFFANNQSRFLAFWKETISYILESCPQIQALEVYGNSRSRTYYEGNTSLNNNWTLVHERVPLDFALEDLEKQKINFSRIYPLDHTLKRYSKILGGKSSLDYQVLETKIKERKAVLAEEKLKEFKTQILSLPNSEDGLKKIRDQQTDILRLLRKNFSDFIPLFQKAINERQRKIGVFVLNNLRQEFSDLSEKWNEAVNSANQINKKHSELKRQLPDIEILANQAISRLENRVTEQLPEFKSSLINYKNDWDSLERLNSDKNKLIKDAQIIAPFKAYVSEIDLRRKAIISSLKQKNSELILNKGSTFNDLEEVIDFGRKISDKFSSTKANNASDEIKRITAQRVNELVDGNYENFEKNITALEATPENRSKLFEVVTEYKTLESTIPAFSRYKEVVQKHATHIEANICKPIIEKFGKSYLLSKKIILEKETISFKQFLCRVAMAGNSLKQKTSFWSLFSSKNNIFQFINSDAEATDIYLQKSKSQDNQDQYLGYKISNSQNEKIILSKWQWFKLAEEMTRQQFTGIPNRKGQTECDHFAADPQDPKKRTLGVKDNELDLKNSLEACIVAVEQNPTDYLQFFQLGRVLRLLGDEKNALIYLQIAANAGHAASYFNLGEILLRDEKQEKLALSNFKKAVSGGYKAAREKVSMLASAYPIDFKNNPPTSGQFKLLCFLEVSNFSVNGSLLDAWGSELKIDADLDANTMFFSHGGMANSKGLELLKENTAYKVDIIKAKYSIKVENIGELNEGDTMTIDARTLKVYHRQNMLVGRLFNRVIRAHMTVTGECMQDF